MRGDFNLTTRIFVWILGVCGVLFIYFFLISDLSFSNTVIEENLEELSVIDKTHMIKTCLEDSEGKITPEELDKLVRTYHSLLVPREETILTCEEYPSLDFDHFKVKDFVSGKSWDFAYSDEKKVHTIFIIIMSGSERHVGGLYVSA